MDKNQLGQCLAVRFSSPGQASRAICIFQPLPPSPQGHSNYPVLPGRFTGICLGQIHLEMTHPQGQAGPSLWQYGCLLLQQDLPCFPGVTGRRDSSLSGSHFPIPPSLNIQQTMVAGLFRAGSSAAHRKHQDEQCSGPPGRQLQPGVEGAGPKRSPDSL